MILGKFKDFYRLGNEGFTQSFSLFLNFSSHLGLKVKVPTGASPISAPLLLTHSFLATITSYSYSHTKPLLPPSLHPCSLLWLNALPLAIHVACSLTSFRFLLKYHLLEEASSKTNSIKLHICTHIPDSHYHIFSLILKTLLLLNTLCTCL